MPRPPKMRMHRSFYVIKIGGVNRKLSPISDGLQQAELRLAQLLDLLAEVAASRGFVPPTGAQITVVDALEEFLDWKKRETSPATFAFYLSNLRPFFERFGRRTLASLRLSDGTCYQMWLRDEKPWKKGNVPIRGVGTCTANHFIRSAKSFLNWVAAECRRYIDRNPWKEISYLPEKPHQRILTEDEFQALLSQCRRGNSKTEAQDYRELLCVMRYSTMRPGEVRKLKWEYIRWNSHQIVFPARAVASRPAFSVALGNEM